MVVGKVVISPAVYRCCLEHALSTEKEEIMGLLIGQVESSDKMKYADADSVYGDIIHFEATKIIRRQDKRPDRVEIPVEQLVFGVQRAEAIEEICNGVAADNADISESKKMRILGWYHSHPHITVWPSHVDLATQYNYQAMDENFVGIIFSLFNDDVSSQTSCYEVTCFQTKRGEDGDMKRLSIPIEIEQSSSLMAASPESSKLRRLIESERLELPATLHEEEIEAYRDATVQKYNNQDIALITAHTETLTFEETTTAFDHLASVKNDVALKLGHTRLFEYVTIPLLEQKQMELQIKIAHRNDLCRKQKMLSEYATESCKTQHNAAENIEINRSISLEPSSDPCTIHTNSDEEEPKESNNNVDSAIAMAIANAANFS